MPRGVEKPVAAPEVLDPVVLRDQDVQLDRVVGRGQRPAPEPVVSPDLLVGGVERTVHGHDLPQAAGNVLDLDRRRGVGHVEDAEVVPLGDVAPVAAQDRLVAGLGVGVGHRARGRRQGVGAPAEDLQAERRIVGSLEALADADHQVGAGQAGVAVGALGQGIPGDQVGEPAVATIGEQGVDVEAVGLVPPAGAEPGQAVDDGGAQALHLQLTEQRRRVGIGQVDHRGVEAAADHGDVVLQVQGVADGRAADGQRAANRWPGGDRHVQDVQGAAGQGQGAVATGDHRIHRGTEVERADDLRGGRLVHVHHEQTGLAAGHEHDAARKQGHVLGQARQGHGGRELGRVGLVHVHHQELGVELQDHVMVDGHELGVLVVAQGKEAAVDRLGRVGEVDDPQAHVGLESVGGVALDPEVVVAGELEEDVGIRRHLGAADAGQTAAVLGAVGGGSRPARDQGEQDEEDGGRTTGHDRTSGRAVRGIIPRSPRLRVSRSRTRGTGGRGSP